MAHTLLMSSAQHSRLVSGLGTPGPQVQGLRPLSSRVGITYRRYAPGRRRALGAYTPWKRSVFVLGRGEKGFC